MFSKRIRGKPTKSTGSSTNQFWIRADNETMKNQKMEKVCRRGPLKWIRKLFIHIWLSLGFNMELMTAYGLGYCNCWIRMSRGGTWRDVALRRQIWYAHRPRTATWSFCFASMSKVSQIRQRKTRNRCTRISKSTISELGISIRRSCKSIFHSIVQKNQRSYLPTLPEIRHFRIRRFSSMKSWVSICTRASQISTWLEPSGRDQKESSWVWRKAIPTGRCCITISKIFIRHPPSPTFKNKLSDRATAIKKYWDSAVAQTQYLSELRLPPTITEASSHTRTSTQSEKWTRRSRIHHTCAAMAQGWTASLILSSSCQPYSLSPPWDCNQYKAQ